MTTRIHQIRNNMRCGFSFASTWPQPVFRCAGTSHEKAKHYPKQRKKTFLPAENKTKTRHAHRKRPFLPPKKQAQPRTRRLGGGLSPSDGVKALELSRNLAEVVHDPKVHERQRHHAEGEERRREDDGASSRYNSQERVDHHRNLRYQLLVNL